MTRELAGATCIDTNDWPVPVRYVARTVVGVAFGLATSTNVSKAPPEPSASVHDSDRPACVTPLALCEPSGAAPWNAMVRSTTMSAGVALSLASTADTRAEAMAILETIGLADKAETLSNRLSQVELRKLELARAMAARPRLLISDEAMAGLAGTEVDEVLAILFKLNESGITIIMIEHIMHAVMRFSHRVVCFDVGRIIAAGSPREVAEKAEVQRVYFGEQARRREP